MCQECTPVTTSFLLVQLVFELLHEAMLFSNHLLRHGVRPIQRIVLSEHSRPQSQSAHCTHNRPDQRAYAPLHVPIHDVFPSLCVFAHCMAPVMTDSSTHRQSNNRQRRHAGGAIFIHRHSAARDRPSV